MTDTVGSADNHHVARRQLRHKLAAEGLPADEIARRVDEMRERQQSRRDTARPPGPRRPKAVPDVTTPARRLASFRPPPKSEQRPRIIARDGHWCRYCGNPVQTAAPKPSQRLTIDHVTPKSRGGSNWSDNRVVACGRCNLNKRDRTLEEWGHPLLPPQGPRAPHIHTPTATPT